MKTKTAFIFAGIDGLDNFKDRIHVLTLPTVVDRVQQAERVLSKIAPEFNLTDFILSPNETFKKEITLQALAVTVVQIGLFDYLISQGEAPDYLMGCSLGDVARTYCAGAVDFEVIVAGSWLYHLQAQKIQGESYHVKCLEGSLTEDMVAEVKSSGIYLAVHQTPKHFLVSGSKENMEAWRQKESLNKRYRISSLYNKPLHSPMMKSVTEDLHVRYAQTLKCESLWLYPMLSSTQLRTISNKAGLMEDMIENFNSTVFWMQALQMAADQMGVQRFVNIGPAATLLLFAERTPLNQVVELINPTALLGDRSDLQLNKAK